jgi:WD40 repeat protein/fibronectin type 3 domain-containing protein
VKKPKLKYPYLNSLILAILFWIVYVQAPDRDGAIKTAHAAGADSAIGVLGLENAGRGLDPVAVSPDGNAWASVETDGKIALWDAPAGQLRLTLPAQAGSPAQGVFYGPDGKTLASVSDDSIRIWDTLTGNVRLTLSQTVPIRALAFSPDGKRLAAADAEAGVALIDVQSGAVVRQLAAGQAAVNAVAFSPDGKWLATGGQDAQTRLWNPATGEEAASLPGNAAVTALAFSPDGKRLAAVEAEAGVALLDVQSGAVVRQLAAGQAGVNVVAFSPDGKWLATGDQDARTRLWDPATGEEAASLLGNAAVTVLAFSPDGKWLATGGEGEQVFLWNLADKLPQLLAGHDGPVVKIAFSADRNILASMARTGQMLVWNLSNAASPALLQQNSLPDAAATLPEAVAAASPSDASFSAALGTSNPAGGNTRGSQGPTAGRNTGIFGKKKSPRHWKGVKALTVSPDGKLVGGSVDGQIKLWTAGGKERFTVPAHHGSAVTAVVFSADGKELVSVGHDSELQIRNVANGQQIQVLAAHEHPVRAVAASPDGKLLASAGEETRIMVWDAEAGKLKNILSGGHNDFVNALCFSADGSHLASAGADGSVLWWEVETGRLVHTLSGHTGEVNAIACSPDGKQVASGGSDNTVYLWDVATGSQAARFDGHRASVRAVAFNPDGQELASTGEDTQILVWDTAAKQLDKQIPAATKAVNALTYSPLGDLVAGGEDGQVSEWDPGTTQKVLTIDVTAPSPASNTGTDPDAAASEVLIADPAGANTAPQAEGGLLGRILNWLIPAAEAAIPEPPGGPILIVTTASDPIGKYYAEILRTEGFNEFAMADIATVNAANLAAYDVVILSRMTLSASQVTLFSNWVNAGGNLIAMRPDAQLAGLLGINAAGGTSLSNGYLLVDTSKAPGNGVTGQTLQFHGVADRYTLAGASSLATLYTNATTATSNPALTLRSVSASGGQAAAFAYDLATSIVQTRQGNPDWKEQERDGFEPIRSDDKFFGDAAADPQPDWIDFNKLAIPQADEQQRLLANLILEMNRDRKPLPRFWYFPRGEKAVVIMTGDDHGNNGTQGRFDYFKSKSPSGCSVADWECVRGTSYIYPYTPLAPNDAAAYNAEGFEVGLHLSTNCGDFTPASLRSFYNQQLADFTSKYSGLPAPVTMRHHCITWSDWVTGAVVQLENGIRFDTSYYFWPPGWVQNRPGFFNGSGMPMRFANLDGSLIDVYNASSHMTDESGQTYPFTINTLLDRALGQEGYYGAFTINAHTDLAQIPESTETVESALARSVPVVSSKQMLDWLDGRNDSSFRSLAWSGNTLSFEVRRGTGANGLQAMVPVVAANGASLTGINGAGGGAVQYTTTMIKGIQYAFFNAAAGTYTATYGTDTTPPTITSTFPASGATGVLQQPAVTATFSEAVDPSTIVSANFQLQAGGNPPVAATVSYDADTRTATLRPSTLLAGSTLYTARVLTGVKDLAGNALASNFTWSFTTQAQPCVSAPCSAWSSSTTPGTLSENDSDSVELGVKFRSDLDGSIAGIRFYQANTGNYTATLWNGSTGQPLATASVTATAAGWQQANFSAPVAITANTVYVASYHAPNGNYAADNLYFATAGVDNNPIHLLQDGVSGGNGVYAYSADITFPSSTFRASNYWVDVVFRTDSGTGPGPDTTPPTVTGQSPLPNATGVATGTTVTATFSEAMQAPTITPSTFELRNAGGTLVPAAVSYAGNTATLTPNAALTAGAAYTATVKGGAAGVKDAAGNALAADVAWSFTTGSGGSGTSCSGATSIWPANPTPSIAADPDAVSVELGVKFQSNTNGFICGIRFYKGSTNTGAHIGKLWSGTGQLLASANFQNETASGWQQVSFATPVAITANTTYVASYLAPVGRYSVNGNYFTSAVTSGPLTALSDTAAGGNGVYQYGSGGFPTDTFQSTNYWVDVLFATDTGPDTTPPTVTGQSPLPNATGVATNTAVTATFSEAMQASSIIPSTFELRNAGSTLVPAAVSYAGNTATLTPNTALTAGAAYTATVKGGAAGVKDAAGNALAADVAWSFTTGTSTCGNPIQCENALPGNPPSEWDVSGAGDESIQGYATDISVNRGGTVRFKIDTPSSDYRLDIYRLGYYGGNGARKVATVQPSASLPQNQPNCLTNAATGLIDCGNWAESASWAVPSNAASGIYIAKAVREDGANTGRASHIVFIVRNDASNSNILFQTSDTTWHAYNAYGGNSLYKGSGPGTGGNADGRAYKVSYNRPFNTRDDEVETWLFNAEYPMVRWLEANGYDVSYFSGVDADRNGALIRNHKIYLTNGHDEYWSGGQRANVEDARNAGVNLALFSGNAIFWKTRWENSIDSSGTPYRTLVCYKETHGYPNNPDPTNVWTGTWRDPRGKQAGTASDGGAPENALSGTIFRINGPYTGTITVPAADGKMRLWRNTTVATLSAGQTATLATGTLGAEVDVDEDNGFRPAGLVGLSSNPISTSTLYALDSGYGSTFGAGNATHRLTLYRHSSGALVFSTGSYQWAWGLDANHDRSNLGSATDVRMQQATVNLLADMGVQPTTLQTGLVAATASTDSSAPTSTITSPTANSNVAPGSTVTITGTAADTGGQVGGVEVSVDGGATWGMAAGRTAWTYSWTAPQTTGPVTIKSRAVDDSLNQETPGTGITVNVGSGSGSDTTAPTVPGGLSATAAGSSQINLAWTASTDNVGVAGYRVERCQGAGCSNFTQVATPTATSYNDTGLTANTTYQYRVRAVDAAGNLGGYSTVVSATTQTGGSTPGGLVAAYAFDEGTGSSAADATGKGHTGTLTGTAWAAGRFGSGLSFNGSSSLVTVADANDLDLGTAMTISAWVNPSVLNDWRTVIMKEAPNGLAYALYGHDTARPAAYINTGGSDRGANGSQSLPANTWSHLAASYDGTTLRLYVNGSLAGSQAVTGTLAATASPLRIGGNAVWGEYFAGLIDEVRIYNRVLSAAEIQADSTTPIGTSGPGSDTTAPTVPGGLSATAASSSQINLTWTASTDNVGVAGYRVERCQGAGCSNFTQVATPTATSYNDTGLTANTTYQYRVRAVDAAGNLGGYSTVVSATTQTGGSAGNTGFLRPTANAAVTSNSGDNNGYQTNPGNAYADDGVFAVDTNSGTGTGSGCTATGKDKHLYYNYGVNLPGGAVVRGIEVRLDARVDSTANAPAICVQLSWDGGTTWTAAQSTSTLTTTEATYVLGGAANLWNRTAWTAGNLSNANFRVRLINVASNSGANSRDFSLDWVAIRVSYQ